MTLYLLINKKTYDVEFASFDKNAAKEKIEDDLVLKELEFSSSMEYEAYHSINREWSKEDAVAQLISYFGVDEEEIKYEIGARFGINRTDEDALDECLDSVIEKIVDVFDSRWDANLDENSMYQNAIDIVLNEK